MVFLGATFPVLPKSSLFSLLYGDFGGLACRLSIGSCLQGLRYFYDYNYDYFTRSGTDLAFSIVGYVFSSFCASTAGNSVAVIISCTI